MNQGVRPYHWAVPPLPYIFFCITLTDGGGVTAEGGNRINQITATASDQNRIHNHHSLRFSRTVHTIHLLALWDSYSSVKATTDHQRCLVICSVKADGYRHGSVQTTKFLAYMCGANAFFIATLEYAITLRRSIRYRFTAAMVILVVVGGGGVHM